MIIHLSGLKMSIKMSKSFPNLLRSFEGNINAKVDVSNYATKINLKNVTHFNTSNFALKINLANLNTEANKLDIQKLAPVPVELSDLNKAVNNDVVKKTIYNKLVTQVNNINTLGFALKKKCKADKTELERQIPDTNKLVKNQIIMPK